MMGSGFCLSDEALLQQIAGGDTAAYTVLYQRYHTRLCRFLRSQLNDPRKTEDLAQEVLLEVWKSAGTYRSLSRVSTWIFGIARFKALTARRRRAEAPVADVESLHIQEDNLSESPEQILLQEEQLHFLHEAFQQLSPSHREVLQLAYGASCSGEEIAGLAGCPAPTVRTRMFNAKRRLKQLLLAGR